MKSADRIAFIVATAFFMQNLDGTIIVTALPAMAKGFGIEPVAMSIGITAYLLSLAAFVPVSGWVADRLGARNVFAAAVAVFTVASLLCALSPNLSAFVAARILQGFGGALMLPVGRLIVLKNSSKAELLRSISMITWPGLVAPVLGPPLGGFLTLHASWEWIFLFNLPIGIAGVAAILRWIPVEKPPERRPFDMTGFLLSGLALMALLYGLEALGRSGADWRLSLGEVAAGLVLGALAVRHFRRSQHPLIDLAAMRRKTFVMSAIGSGTVFRAATAAMPFLIPLFFQLGLGLDAFQAGLLLLVYFAGNLAMKSVTTPILQRFGFRPVLLWNGIAAALTMGGFAFIDAGTPFLATGILLLVSGMTRSLQFTSLNTLAFADLEGPERGPAATLSAMTQQIAACLGIALASGLLTLSKVLVTPATRDFHIAFLVVGALGLVSALRFLAIPPNAGQSVTQS